jgi:serine/threonine-protein kinase
VAIPAERLWEWFDQLVELEPAAADLRLEQLATTDPELAQELRGLLAADRAHDAVLDQPAGEDLTALAAGGAEEAPSALGLAFGPWVVVGLIGRGGMGEVWEVHRADGAYDQTAALKVLRLGLDSEAALTRFQAERQILATLDHPAIARLLDGGRTSDGRPYLVMERVVGLPITAHAAAAQLGVSERVRLVRELCEAVDVAHRALVVHRDIKPSNVLVTAGGQPKLLDFGIAKLLDPELQANETRLEDRALTPAYAAPEQILGAAITTATDVYALGVLLFELLTGAVPHGRSASSWGRLVAELATEGVVRPSAAVRERLRSESRAGGAVNLPRVQELEGDLDAIVSKALEPDPKRRYRSAAELGDDLGRHLRGLPVLARPATAWYRAGRFIARHRAGVAATTIGVVALLAALVVSLFQTRRAEAEARRAERAREVLVSILEGADPENTRGREVTVRELLEQSGPRIEREVADDPELRDELLMAVARVEVSLGDYEAAVARARAAFASMGSRSTGAASTKATRELAAVLAASGEYQEAEALLAPLLADLEAASGSDAVAVAEVEVQLGGVLESLDRPEEAQPMLEHALAVMEAELGEDHPDTLGAAGVLAMVLDSQDRLDRAVPLYRRVAAGLERRFGSDSPQTLIAFHNVGMGLLWSGEYRESQQWFERTIEGMERVLGPEHPRLAFTLNQYANLLSQLERDDEADVATRRAMAVFAGIEADHPEVANGHHSLAISALRRDDWQGADVEFAQAVGLWEKTVGPEHGSVGIARAYRAIALAHQGAADPARQELAVGLQILEGSAGGRLVNGLRAAAEVESVLGNGEGALDYARRSHQLGSEVFGVDHPVTDAAALNLARVLVDLGQDTEAAALVEQVRGHQLERDPDSGRLAQCDLLAGRIAWAAGRPEAEAYFRLAEQQLLKRRAAEHPRVREVRDWLVRIGSAAQP